MAGIVSVPILASTFDTQAIMDAFSDALLETAIDMLNEYEQVVATWQDKPIFDVQDIDEQGGLAVIVGTDDQVFAWVNDGTSPHLIPPRGRQNGGADSIAYPRNFSAKSRPGMLTARQGGKSGPLKVWPRGMAVAHPGVEPRQFDTLIGDKYQRILEERVRAILLNPDYFGG